MKSVIKFFILLSLTFTIANAQQLSSMYDDAMEAFHQKEYYKAQKMFKAIGEAREDDPQLISAAKFYEAESYLLMGEVDAALPLYEGYEETYLLSSYREKVLYRLGTLYFEDKEFKKSRSKLLALVNDYPASINVGSANYLIGDTYYLDGNYSKALEFYTRAEDHSVTNKYMDKTIFSMGNCYEQLGQYDEAVASYDEILSYYRESDLLPQAQMRIGVSYFKQNKLDNAIIELSDPLISELPEKKQSEAMMVLANSFFRLKEYTNAKEIFAELIDNNPELADQREIRFALAKINFQAGQFSDAYDEFIDLSEQGSDSLSANSLYWAAESQRYMNNGDKARELYDQFIRQYPDNKLSAQVSYNLSSIAYGEKKTGSALEYLESSLTSDDNATRARSYALLGEIKLNEKDYNGSAEAYENALKYTEEDSDLRPQALLGICNCKLLQGRF